MIYKQQDDPDKALEYLYKSLAIREELGEKGGIAESMINLGFIYQSMGELDSALKYDHKCLKLYEELGYKRGIASAINNIAAVYQEQSDTSTALEYFYKGLKMYEELGNKRGTAIALNNIGNIEMEQMKLEEAFMHGTLGLDIAQKMRFPSLIARHSRLLSKVTKKQGKYKEALGMYELYIKMRDSIKNEETQKAAIRQQTKYEFEKAQLIKEQEDKEAARIVDEAMSRRDNLQYSIILIAILSLFGGVLALGFINVSERMAEGIIFFSFLILF